MLITKKIKAAKLIANDKWYRWRNRKNLIYEEHGIKIFVGAFGSGKTSSMVQYAYNIATNWKDVSILTNMKLFNFPCEVTVLTNYQQIVNAPNNTIVIVDEISSIFNSRNWAKGKRDSNGNLQKNKDGSTIRGMPDSLRFTLLQVRKKNMLILSTAQEFYHVDNFLRNITKCVIECECWFGRLNTCYVFDGPEYSSGRLTSSTYEYSFVQTDEIRSLYDTYEQITDIDFSDGESIVSEDTEHNKEGYTGMTTGKRKRGRPRKQLPAPVTE